ncbi:hypothetical protein ACS0TY_002994 [Phlomoides rotata]
MLKTDFQCGYKKLSSSSDEKASRRRRRRRVWLKKVKGVKLERSRRKLNWKAFSIMYLLSRKIARKYVDFVERMNMEEACRLPSIVLSCNWGLPILSHKCQSIYK